MKKLPKATLSTLSEIHDESANASRENNAETVAESTPETVTAMVPVAQRPAYSELHRAQALNIVERYTTYSALGGCIPLAIFDSLSVGVIVFNMVRALAEHYRVPFQQDRMKAGIAAVLAGVVSPGLGDVATHLAGKLIPGAWLISTAVSSAAAAGLTRYTGEAFIKHFESGGTTLNFDMAQIQAYFTRKMPA